MTTEVLEQILKFTFKNNDGVDIECEIRPETVATQRMADDEYHQIYVGCIKRGIPPRSVLEKMLYDREMWTKADDETLRDLQLKVATLEKELETNQSKADRALIAKNLSDTRSTLLDLVRARGDILNNSAEYVADYARRDAVIAFNSYYVATGQKIYKSYDDFIERSDEDVTLAARRAVTIDMLKSFSAFVDSLPESEFVDAQQGELAEMLEGINEAREVVNDEDSAPSKKKTPRKKSTPTKKK